MAPHPVVPIELTQGPFTVDEARRHGLTRWHLKGASWRRIARGTYTWVGLPPGPAVALSAIGAQLPAEAVFSGRTAAWLHGLDVPFPEIIEVTIPRECGVTRRHGVAISRAHVDPEEVVHRQGQ